MTTTACNITTRKKIAFTCVTIAMIFGLFNAFCVFLYDETLPYAAMIALADANADTSVSPHVYIRLASRAPNENGRDANGFIGPTIHTDDADLTILFLGGSTTECIETSEYARFVYRVAIQLSRQSGRRVRTINAGMAGAHSMHSNVKFLALAIKEKPDIAVMMHAINDITTMAACGTYWNNHPARSLVVDGDMVPPSDEWGTWRDRPLAWGESEAKQQFRSSLKTFVGICRANGITPVLMTQATQFTGTPSEMVKDHLQRSFIPYDTLRQAEIDFNEITRSVARDEGIVLIDLDRGIEPVAENFVDSIHFNDAGSIAAGEIIADALASQLMKGK